MGIVGADAIVSGILYEDDIRLEMRKHYQACPSVSRVLVHERQILDVKSANPLEQLNDLSLTVFNGEYAMFWVYLMRGSAEGEGRYSSNRNRANIAVDAADTADWVPIARASFTDSDGNPVWYNFVQGEFIRRIASAQNFPSVYVYGEKHLYPFCFSTDPVRTMATGGNFGGLALDSNFQMQLVPGNFNTTGETSYSLRINALRYCLLTRSGTGEFKVTKL